MLTEPGKTWVCINKKSGKIAVLGSSRPVVVQLLREEKRKTSEYYIVQLADSEMKRWYTGRRIEG